MLGKLTVFRRGKRVTNQLFRNSIGPVLALWSIYQSASVEMKEAPSPLIIGIVDFGSCFHAHFRCEKYSIEISTFQSVWMFWNCFRVMDFGKTCH